MGRKKEKQKSKKKNYDWFKPGLNPIHHQKFGSLEWSHDLRSLCRNVPGTHKIPFIWPCPLCKKTFTSERSVREHRYTAHGRPLLWCKPCGADFHTDAELAEHVEEFEGVKCELPCWVEGCRQTFHWARDRIRHIENNHWYGMSEEYSIVRYDMQAKKTSPTKATRQVCQKLMKRNVED